MSFVCLFVFQYLTQTGSKQEKEYVKAVYCHPTYLTYMQSTSGEMLGWKKHQLESRLDYKDGRMPKNCYLQTVVLEKAPESPLDSKEIKPVNLKGDQP